MKYLKIFQEQCIKNIMCFVFSNTFRFECCYLHRLCGLWSEFLATDPEVQVRFPALTDFLISSGSGKGSTQPREYN
jgi:hypothetical protein